MSKREIQVVCELAAHLALKAAVNLSGPDGPLAPRCAADAMRLQRLAQNVRHKAKDIQRMAWIIYLRGMTEKAEAVLKPYGLVGALSKRGIVIEGLPGNTGGGEDGYGI